MDGEYAQENWSYMVFNLDTFISLCIQFPNVWYKSLRYFIQKFQHE